MDVHDEIGTQFAAECCPAVRRVYTGLLMFKKILLAIVAILIVVPAAGLAYLYLRKPAQSPPSTLKVAMTPERIARGKYIFENLGDCDGCHSQRDFTRIDGPVVPSGRGRG